MTELQFDKITIDKLILPFAHKGSFHVLRLDKIHPLVSGNKWYKLRYYLEEALIKRKKGIITFGGAWSNHLLATAAACKMKKLASIGIIRGEEPAQLSTTLLQAKELGMKFFFVEREEYRSRAIPPITEAQDFLVVAEGGYGELGAKGASEILNRITPAYTHYCCAVGTGTMMAGIINNVPGNARVQGISVLKNNQSLEVEVTRLVRNKQINWNIHHEFHFGGYAKHPGKLISFMNEFYRHSNIPSDIVYTGKLFFAICELCRQNFFPVDSNVLIIHSGGLQGNNSLQKGTLIY